MRLKHINDLGWSYQSFDRGLLIVERDFLLFVDSRIGAPPSTRVCPAACW